MNQLQDIREVLRQRIENLKTQLNNLLNKKKGIDDAIDTLQRQLDYYEAVLRMEEDAIPKVPAQQIPLVDKEAALAAQAREFRFKGMTIAAAAEQIIREAGRPLHASKIWESMEAGGLKLKTKTPVISVTSALIRRKDVFENIGSRTFRLASQEGEINT